MRSAWRRWRVDIALGLLGVGFVVTLLGTSPAARALGVGLVTAAYAVVAFDLAPRGRR